MIKGAVSPYHSIVVRNSALIRPCLGLFPLRTTLRPFIFLATLPLLLSCPLLPLVSPLLFPCARYPVCDTIPSAWDPRSLQSGLDDSPYFEANWAAGRKRWYRWQQQYNIWRSGKVSAYYSGRYWPKQVDACIENNVMGNVGKSDNVCVHF